MGLGNGRRERVGARVLPDGTGLGACGRNINRADAAGECPRCQCLSEVARRRQRRTLSDDEAIDGHQESGLAAAIVDAHAEAYLQEERNQKLKATRTANAWLTARVGELEAQFAHSKTKLRPTVGRISLLLAVRG